MPITAEPKPSARILLLYIEDKQEDELIFPNLTVRKASFACVNIGQIRRIEKGLTFHMARHTFATMSLSKGVPIESVSKMLGHTNIKTTQIYARITNKKIEQDMLKLSDKLDIFRSPVSQAKQ